MKFFKKSRNPFLGLAFLIDRLRRYFAPRPQSAELRSRIRVAFIAG
jgi:hypothetical protein